ncbi:ERMIN protein, partial [Turnix velox]|nr:ERMIN protein [Turnix velox]
MTEEVPAASTMLECNGSIPPERGTFPHINEIAKSVGTVPYTITESSPEASPDKENQEETRNSLSEDVVGGDLDGEKQCKGKVQVSFFKYHSHPYTLRVTAGPSSGGTGTVTSAGGDTAGTLAASTDGTQNAAEEEEVEVEEEEEDTEEDEVKVMDLKKQNSEASRLELQGSSKEPSPPPIPECNSQAEKAGEQLSLGKKNDISRHSYSRYNTISYRRIRKGNTKQRIDEFESMMHL